MKRFVILSAVLAALVSIGGCKKKAPKVAVVAPPRAQHDLMPPAGGTQTTDTVPANAGMGATDDDTSQDTATAQDAPPQAQTYTIQKGDTLWSIAVKLLGDGQRWKDIKAANPSLDEKKLPIGKAITIPPK